VVLERLPKPEDTRSLTGSIRIFFHKVISKPIGLNYPYPLLAVADVTDDGEVTYDADPDEVARHVTEAKRIVLYIHGIIGDTRAMAASARYLKEQPTEPLTFLHDHHDLILTFDYENINDPIEETALALKQRLADVGLKAGHEKTLHMVAHSMGGLVSRWFIEQEGGHEIVQHLVMLGTPNGGSPWSTIQQWATTALGMGLNSLGSVIWPVKVIGGLLSAIEKIDVTLDQMAPGSEILNTLEASDNPKVPYTIIAGNTSLRPSEADADEEKSRFERLLSRLAPKRLLHGVTSLAFFSQPNDIAVSVESIGRVPRTFSCAQDPKEIYCDHLSYFTTEAGLQALSQALGYGAEDLGIITEQQKGTGF
jgi:pimeloyl-ACP methyl ester carboxylesterase